MSAPGPGALDVLLRQLAEQGLPEYVQDDALASLVARVLDGAT